ncbi:MAG: alternative ribosome rescue aminoacyl-tRNA hydrolase ArfB [Gemmatimonadota bacterium]|nr:alternative ribosome rescue aminoacyl-tRNA hydrolase ArfB [Gemmatimonadota bacterium]
MKEDSRQSGLPVRVSLVIPESELEARATRSGGPGGQHVNTSSTRVELVWRLSASRVVTDDERTRIRRRLASRIDADGNVRVAASDTRSQRQNRMLAGQRLAALVAQALHVPRARKKTRPTRASVERRLTEKRRRSERKRDRRDAAD